MADVKATVALNVGSQRISMGVFKSTKNGGLILEKYESTTILADPALEMTRLSQVQEAVSGLVENLKVGKAKVSYAISGQSVFSRFIKLPPIEDDNIEQLVAFEAQQHVPFPLNEVVWDWQPIEGGVGEKEVAIVAVKGDTLNEINDAVTAAGVGTLVVDAAPMALYNALRYNYPEVEETTLLIDIGAKTCNLVYLEGKKMFTRSVAVGGASITTAIAKEYGISFSEAEMQKCTNGQVALNTVHTSQLDEATAALATLIRNTLGKLPAEIARTTNYYRSQHGGKAPKKILLAGGGANLAYIADFFQEKLRLPIEFFNPLKQVSVGGGVDVDRISAEAHMLGELVGLGLRGIGKASLEVDLVPNTVAHERDVARRKPYLIAASAIFLAGSLAWAISNASKNDEASSRLQKLDRDHVTLLSYHKPLKKLAEKEKRLDAYQKQLMSAQTARSFWVNMLSDLAHNFASDTVWLVDFDPVVGFNCNSGATGKGGMAHSVVVSNFRSVSYGDSALGKINAVVAPESSARKRGGRRAAKDAVAQPMINAIRVKGFWRGGSDGYKTVYKLLRQLRDNSVYFDVPRQEDLSITLSDKLENGDYAAPFEFVLPLRHPIPAPKGKSMTR